MRIPFSKAKRLVPGGVDVQFAHPCGFFSKLPLTTQAKFQQIC